MYIGRGVRVAAAPPDGFAAGNGCRPDGEPKGGWQENSKGRGAIRTTRASYNPSHNRLGGGSLEGKPGNRAGSVRASADKNLIAAAEVAGVPVTTGTHPSL